MIKKLSITLLSSVILLGLGCKKTNDNLSIPPEQATFTGKTFDTYYVLNATSIYKVPVGVTAVSSSDRTIKVNVTSPTGAVLGTHYTLSSTTITIPAGKAIDSITVKGVLAQYAGGRKDTLIFTISEPGVPASDFNKTFKLLVRGACFEGDIVLTELLGDYDNTNEDFGGPYGPYTTTITAVNQLTATTGTITVANIFDNGWNPIKFTLDWTDPANRKVTLVQQAGIGDAGTINPAYAGEDITVKPFTGQTGTFSYCNSTISLKMQVGVTGLGFFPSLYTVNMAR
jgi:hypothetical protein